MNTVLIVDDEEIFLSHIETGLAEYKDYFTVLTAKNGKQAAEILQSSFVDLVVTDLKMPEMDGFELLAFIASNFATIPVIVMTGFMAPEVERQLRATGILTMIEKPIELGALAESIIEGLETAAEEGVLTGVSLDSFIQLVEMEQKTCLLEVQRKGEDMEKCLLLFADGELYDAAWGELKGEKAAHEIIGLKDVQIRFKKLSPGRKVKRRIEKPLMSILMEATRLRDEAEDKQGGEGTDSQANENSRKSVSDGFTLLEEDLVLDVEDLELDEEELSLGDDYDEDDDDYDEEEDAADEKENSPDSLNKKAASAHHSTVELNSSQKNEPSSTIKKKHSGSTREAAPEASDTEKPKGGIQMAVKNVLEEMSQEIDGLVVVAISGLDGVLLGQVNPGGAQTEFFGARFAMLMKMEQKITQESEKMGGLEENIMQSQNMFIYTQMLGKSYYLAIAISKEGTLGMVRMVARKYESKLRSELGL